jgi:hypothetical protein
MTLHCCCCQRNFSPTLPRRYPEFPGYCDECGELEEETRPPSELERKICDLRIGGSLFFPATAQDPRPWETIRAEIARTRWIHSTSALCVHRVQKGDVYIATREGQEIIDFESADGARLYKSLTFEDLSLGLEYVRKITSEV